MEPSMNEDTRSFADVKERLDEIVDEVSREDISLDDALTLYEEAVKLGLGACNLSENDIFPAEIEAVEEAVEGASEDATGEGAAEDAAGEGAVQDAMGDTTASAASAAGPEPVEEAFVEAASDAAGPAI